MEARILGWAGVELRGTTTVVIDPLADAGAVWAAAGDLARRVPLPPVVAPERGAAAAGLLTHLHRDHADAAALAAALAPGAPVFGPEPFGGGDLEQAALAQAEHELRAVGLELVPVRAWEAVEAGEWSFTAVPAVDGTGDPQVSWLVTGAGATVLHAGDTMPHGWWWRIAQRAADGIDVAFLPINAPRVAFPHRQPASPLPIVMGGREAAVAGALLRARRVVPIHFGAYDFDPIYVPDHGALDALHATAAQHGVTVEEPELGAWFGVRPPVAAQS